MARPIKETPILFGEDARRFEERMKEKRRETSEQRAKRLKDYELAITNNVAGVTTAIIILLIIGALSGIWMISGVVPTLIYYGMQIIHPSFFLTSTCIICVLISVMTGSSWTTIATIGIALMGIGKAQGFEEGWIAGAIISGAYFGDKVSPLSETTILAASVTDTPLFRHIRYMMITTVPSLIITLLSLIHISEPTRP